MEHKQVHRQATKADACEIGKKESIIKNWVNQTIFVKWYLLDQGINTTR